MNIGIIHSVSVGSWDWVAENIQNTADSINGMMSGIVEILQDQNIYQNLIGGIPDGITSAVKGVALSLVTLFFVLDFIHKSLDLKWVTWENVMMFVLKVVIAKMCVDNAAWLMECIYNGFNSLMASISPDITLIPDGEQAYEYFLSTGDVANLINQPHLKWYDFTPVGLWITVTIQGFVMKGMLAVTLVIVLARFLELAIYTIAAPIPLATLGCDGLQDVGKSYLKSYAACCIHAMVILMIFVAYGVLNGALGGHTGAFGLGGFMGLIKTFILGGTVMKSEQWAKRICGAI